MGDHSRANASAPIGQNSEHSSVQGDQNRHPEAWLMSTSRLSPGLQIRERTVRGGRTAAVAFLRQEFARCELARDGKR